MDRMSSSKTHIVGKKCSDTVKIYQRAQNLANSRVKLVILCDEFKLNRFQSNGKQYFWGCPHQVLCEANFTTRRRTRNGMELLYMMRPLTTAKNL